RDEILRALDARPIDDHLRGAELLEKAERVSPMLVVEPAQMPELNEHVVFADLLPRPFQVLQRAIFVHDIGGKLEEDPAELSRRAKRLERLEEAPEDLPSELARRPVDAALLVGRCFV